MAPTTTALFRAARPLFQQQPQLLAGASMRSAFARQQATFRSGARRFQSTTAGSAPPPPGANPSWFNRMWNSPIGLKTVHFWAPVMKWSLVLAGVADFARPAEKLSLTQNAALSATGAIWTRWCLIIKPKNYLLAAVNFFLGCVGVIQVTRIMLHERSKKNSVAGVIEDVKQDVKETVHA